MIIFDTTLYLSKIIKNLGYRYPEFSWGLAVFIMVTGLLLSSTRSGTMLREARFANIMSAVASILISINIVTLLVYLVLPQYFDHVEPQVVITALNAHQGLPLYPNWSRGEGAYGLPYGPLLYAAVGMPLFANKSIIASKLVTSCAFLFAAASIWAFRRQSPTPSAALLVKVYLLALMPFGTYAFWVRPEPLLLALAAAGVMAIRIRNDRLRWLTLGVFAGLAVAIKISAVLCFIPLAVFAFVRASDAKAATLGATCCAVGFSAAVVTAFEGNPQEAVNLGRYLSISSREGFSPYLVFGNLLAALALTTPYGLALWQRRESLWRDWRTVLTAASMSLSVALMIIVGANAGAGPHHLMPFIPVLLFLALTARGPDVIEANDPSPILVAAMIAAALAPLAGTAVWLRGAIPGASDTIAAYREAADLAILDPGAQFGPTDNAHYNPTLQYRVGAALQGAKLTFSVAAWADLDFAGIRPTDDPADFSPGPPVWILPRDGAPFSLGSWYKNSSMFSPAFQTDFRSRCQQIDVRKTFAAWRCGEGR
jgi:hypothetical protein